MLFNSFAYVVFFPLMVLLHFLTPHRHRWMVLLAGSYFFYMSWKPAYVVLILTATLVSWVAGLRMERTASRKKRRAWLVASLVVCLGILFVFKYFNFFNHAVADMAAALGLTYSPSKLDVLLPVGISFYTFQTLSYTVDVYRDKVPVERHFGKFALYVAFFPQLVAGPIERAGHLLPQFAKKMTWDVERVAGGLRLALWGLFKKMVVADNLAVYVDKVYKDPAGFDGFSLLLGTYLFAIQIYCDFSGYTDVARGSARVLGFDLMENFRAPYLARNLTDFWRRWHISLSTWLRDYLYIPLGGNRDGRKARDRNLLITMLLGGLWHGANWTFVVWGAIHGLALGVGKRLREALGSRLPGDDSANPLVHVAQVLFTFHVVCLAWIFFRAPSIGDAWTVLTRVVTMAEASGSILAVQPRMISAMVFSMTLVVVAADLLQAPLRRVVERYWLVRHVRDTGLALFILVFGAMEMSSFIYFQF